MLQQTPSTFQLNTNQEKVAGRPLRLNGRILVIVEVCFISMAPKFKEYFQIKVHHQ